MSKYTRAVIMPSPARLGPWGDDAWQFAGAIQYVSKGPDFLYAGVPSLDGSAEPISPPRFASMVVRDKPTEKAEDIAVMAYAVLEVNEWQLLHPWWGKATERVHLRHVLENVSNQYRGDFKLAVVDTSEGGLGEAVHEALRALGFEVVSFVQNTAEAFSDA